ncbi:MAG: DDE-type integrase/transposase/recombinase [Rhodospirillaceae bacterium]
MSYDFVEDRTHDGRKFCMLNILDEYTHECLAIRVDRRLKGVDVIDVLTDLFILCGVPANIRSDNGPEFIAKDVQAWIKAVGAKTASYRSRKSVGKRLHRELQRPPARRIAGWRDFLRVGRGQGHHQKLAAPLQHRQDPRLARLQAPGTGGFCALWSRAGDCATLTSSVARPGPKLDGALTFNPDQSVGAGHDLVL